MCVCVWVGRVVTCAMTTSDSVSFESSSSSTDNRNGAAKRWYKSMNCPHPTSAPPLRFAQYFSVLIVRWISRKLMLRSGRRRKWSPSAGRGVWQQVAVMMRDKGQGSSGRGNGDG